MGILFCHLRIIYPACAGVNLAVARCQKVYFYFPRMRGGQPDWAQSIQSRVLFSPHARGSTPHPQSFRRGYRILPACAGVNLTCRCSGCMMMHSPRMCGGQPDFIVDAYTTLFFSLHMQGCSFFTTQNCLEEIT